MFGWSKEKDAGFENIGNDAFKSGISREDAVVLDVRTPIEVSEGIIPGALILDYNNPSQFVPGINELDKEKAYYIYCRSGARSAAACAHLSQLGFDELYNLQGGILGWDGPLEK